MSCVCFKGCQETVTYHGKTAAFQSERDGSELVMCKWCEGLISRTPTTREKQFTAGTLRWQHWPDRAHTVPEIEPDYFASAIADALPRLPIPHWECDESFAETLVSATPVTLLNGDESGTGAGLISQN